MGLIIIVFDCCCTFAAELMLYPDHLSYDDFWNATTMTEFLSKMNRLIPDFFRVHVLYELVAKAGMKFSRARAVSFLTSALLLEVLLVPLCVRSNPE